MKAIKTIFLTVLFFGYFVVAKNSWAAEIQAESCNQADVQSAIDSAQDGDIVSVPAGNCMWDTANKIIINKRIKLHGGGIDSTNINIGAGDSYAPVINFAAVRIVFEGFTVTNNTPSYGTYVSSSASDFRITDCRFVGVGYGIQVQAAYGLIDANIFDNTGEFIQITGKCDSWQRDDAIGTANNVFVENNTINGTGRDTYLTCNADGRCVFRYNTITGWGFYEAHQACTNTNHNCLPDTHRGPRNSEVYNNLWNTSKSYVTAIDILGGTGRAFNNIIITPFYDWIQLGEYTSQYTFCYNHSGCTCEYPAIDQIGVGADPLSPASDPFYFWNNKMGTTLTNISQAAMDAHTIVKSASDTCKDVSQCGPDYTASVLIQANRDYFISHTKPVALSGYIPYACPHPLTGLSGSCDSNAAGMAGYNLTISLSRPSGLSVR